MNPIGATELARLRTTQESFFPDVCVFVIVTITFNSWNEEVEAETVSAAKECRFVPQASFSSKQLEYADQLGTIQTVGAIVRLPVSEYTSLSTIDRIKIIERNGEALVTPLTFSIMGDPQLLTTCTHINLQDVSR